LTFRDFACSPVAREACVTRRAFMRSKRPSEWSGVPDETFGGLVIQGEIGPIGDRSMFMRVLRVRPFGQAHLWANVGATPANPATNNRMNYFSRARSSFRRRC
jgi:hypothetical protein